MPAKEANQDNYFDNYDDYEEYNTTVNHVAFNFRRLGRVVSCWCSSGGYNMPTNWTSYFTLPEKFKPASGDYVCMMSQPSVSTSGGARFVVRADGTVQTYTSSNSAQSMAGGAYIAKKV